LEKFDIGINIIHGKYGEDGTIQKIFEKNNFPFLGTDSRVSKITMEKNLTKKIFSEKKILYANSIVFTKKSNINYNNIFKKLGKKIIIKPINSGSSFGISVAENILELKKSIKIAFKISQKIILEEFLEGKEFSCGVYFDGKKDKALPVVQIKYPGKTFFDYDAKYNNLSKEICPAKIDKKLTEKIQKKSVLIFNKMGCKDFSRIDFMVSKNKIYVIEINTLPGFTPESIFPKELRVAKIKIFDFFKILINSKLKNK
jgi:D-alanine-D-alanine ligase